ncbi:ubiquitin thioesterase otubain-like [Onthophagus taurus]|uniref:ubiquitin thioesterase otubain-like n=1 Tax=Onthophagus taurus TaxID=166361 RepID=UPI000C201091|nr:ubiquitin thioesterase otubain-like [Onthophagus taurus]
MGDNTESTNDNMVPAEGQINQDELILQQQRQIQQEISETISLVGELDTIQSLHAEYAADEVYLEKIKDLSSKYKFIRRTRPDGNCFFRAFSYGYIEKLLNNKEDFNTFFMLASNSKNSLVQLGFPQFTVEDFYDTFMEVLKRIGETKNVNDARRELHTLFNEQGYSDYMVVYLRLLTSGQLQRDQDFYSCFIEGDRTVADFCHQEVEPMYKESDHIHIMAACSAMNTGVRVVYMDRGNNKQVTEHDLPEGSDPYVHLLYRPGHYDILYPNN